MPASPLLARLLASPPQTHVSRAGEPRTWGVATRVLEVIDEFVEPDARTLETGAGLSTALFAMKGARHDCVVPFAAESERLTAWSEAEGVSLENVTFHHGFSDRVLPALPDDPLDLVLIDGGHGFPIPFIDWWYAGRRLRVGGLVIIDDIHLWTGRVLTGFLDAQDGWELAEKLPMRSSVFRRTSEGDSFKEWVDQPYLLRRSFHAGARGLIRRAARAPGAVRSRRGG